MIILTKEVRQRIELERPRAFYPSRLESEGMGIAIVEGRLRYMNSVASLIYSLSDGKHRVKDIVNTLAKQYPEIAREELFLDTLRAIREFQHLGMICRKTWTE